MTKYSQYDEQQYILSAFGDRGGRFLDVGATTHSEFTSTWALCSWAGLA